MVTGDRSQLVQLLDNLFGDGLKYRGDQAPRIRGADDSGVMSSSAPSM